MSDTKNVTTPLTADCISRLVRLVRNAVDTTAGSMPMDLLVYDEDEEKIAGMLKAALEWGDKNSAVKYALESLFVDHEETMKDAAQEGARSSLRDALNSLPNADVEARRQ